MNLILLDAGLVLAVASLYWFSRQRQSALPRYAGPAIVMAIAVGLAALGGGFDALKALSALGNLAGAEPGKLAGRWTNADKNTASITRIEIGSGFAGVKLSVWGKCQPRDCDWGSPASYENRDLAKGTLSVTWDHRFARRDQQLSLQPDGRLQVVTQTHFVDRSRRKDYRTTEYFVQAP